LEIVSGTVIKIWRLKDNRVTTLIFLGHVTSSVTWPFDSQWSTSDGWSTGPLWPRVYLGPLWRYGRLKFFQEASSRNSLVVGRSSILHLNMISYTPLHSI